MEDNFSEKLKKIMFEKGITQKELAEKLGVSQAFISSWQVGKRHPKLSSIKKIAKAVNVPVNYFITDEHEQKDIKNSKDLIIQMKELELRILKIEKLLEKNGLQNKNLIK